LERRPSGDPTLSPLPAPGTRGRIGAATELLLQQGPFGDLRVEDILALTDVSRSTFYTHFGSKHDVLAELLAGAADDLTGVVDRLAAQGTDPPDRWMRRSVAGFASAWRRHEIVLQAAHQHWHGNPRLTARWLELHDRLIEAGAIAIDAGRERGSVAAGPPAQHLAATMVWGSTQTLLMSGLGTVPALDDEAAVSTLTHLFLRTLVA
jgi:AcrR family transcriptional regulator